MSIEVKCPGCGRVRSAPEEWQGKQARCNDCGTMMTISAAVPALPATRPVAPSSPPPMAPSSPKSASVLDDPPLPVLEENPLLAEDESFPDLTKNASALEPAETTLRSKTSVDNPTRFVMEGMIESFSLGRIVFVVLGMAGMGLVCHMLSLLSDELVKSQWSTTPATVIFWLTVALVVGLSGMLVGGLAYMCSQDGRRSGATFLSAFAYCGRRFPAFFGGALLFAGLLGAASWLMNALVFKLNTYDPVGKSVAAALFLPQFIVNVLVIFLTLISVVFFSVMVVEKRGPIRGMERLAQMLTRHTGSLLTTFFVSMGLMILQVWVMKVILLCASTPTLIFNGPRAPLAQQLMTWSLSDLLNGQIFPSSTMPDRPGMMSSRHGGFYSSNPRTGDLLRQYALALVWMIFVAVPVTFWVSTFTRYYEAMHPRLAKRPP
ncbi:MAG: hypothetical protein JW818_07025 [Pirellulales bacterium]|nr:hypothetical protein [Pirellulales bacterium]